MELSTDGTKNAVNLKKRENQYRTSLETYKTEKTTNNDAGCRGVYQTRNLINFPQSIILSELIFPNIFGPNIFWLWIDRKELRDRNTENMDQEQKICSLDRKIVLRSQILV